MIPAFSSRRHDGEEGRSFGQRAAGPRRDVPAGARARRAVAVADRARTRCRPVADTARRADPVTRHGERGQATVELLALAPIIVAAAVALLALLAAGRAKEIAGSAAQAGAMALLQDADAAPAAREVVPESHRSGLEVVVRGRAVTVHVRPRVPVLAARLAATSTAYAGARP